MNALPPTPQAWFLTVQRNENDSKIKKSRVYDQFTFTVRLQAPDKIKQ
jgi:hypothetical protein